MRATILLFIFVAGCYSLNAQTRSTQPKKSPVPVYLTHTGQDDTGRQFVDAVRRVMSKSERYELADPNASGEGRFRLYVGISTLDLASAGCVAEQPSAASVVVEEMGLPNSWPGPSMWYHKVFIVNISRLDDIAQKLVADMDADWCNHIKSSVGNCPKESIPPIYP